MKRLHPARWFFTPALLLFMGGGTTGALAATIQFNELPEQTANGLSFNGVTFGFEINGLPSSDSTFGALGPGTITYLQDEVLEGDANGELTLDFGAPQSAVAFGLALGVFQDLTPGATVSLYDASLNLVLQQGLDTHTLVDFSEGLFEYQGASFTRVVMSFDPAGGRFALDNLTFEPALPAAVPESLSPWFVNAFLAGIAGVGGYLRRTRSITAS